MSAVVDHVAIEVDDLDARVEQLVNACGMRVLRRGTRWRTGQRIAMLGDGTGFKVELIEARAEGSPRFVHLAFRVQDTDESHDTLLTRGWQSLNPPHDLSPAKARTALLSDGRGLNLQLITYQSGSPDMRRWTDGEQASEPRHMSASLPQREPLPGSTTPAPGT